jgi:hypothetical protein
MNALGHAHRSTTGSFYDHAENGVDAQPTGLLRDWLAGEGSAGEGLQLPYATHSLQRPGGIRGSVRALHG